MYVIMIIIIIKIEKHHREIIYDHTICYKEETEF